MFFSTVVKQCSARHVMEFSFFQWLEETVRLLLVKAPSLTSVTWLGVVSALPSRCHVTLTSNAVCTTHAAVTSDPASMTVLKLGVVR